MMRKPKVFIGSSIQSREIARAIQAHLEPEFQVRVWSDDTFEPSEYSLDSLLKELDTIDFGVFVLAADDKLKLKDTTYAAARDNVVYEAGLFTGRIGRERTLLLRPVPRQVGNSEPLRIPSDLAGLTLVEYDADLVSDDVLAALAGPSHRIRMSIRAKGLLSKAGHPVLERVTQALEKLVSHTASPDPAREVEQTWSEQIQVISDTLSSLWPADEILVSLRVPSADAALPDADDVLETIYPPGTDASRRRNRLPVPCSRCLAGDVLAGSEPFFADMTPETIDALRHREPTLPERGQGSVALWPVVSEGVPFAVLELESPKAGLLSESNALLKQALQLSTTMLSLTTEIWRLSKAVAHQSAEH
jgi:hypothetical protein